MTCVRCVQWSLAAFATINSTGVSTINSTAVSSVADINGQLTRASVSSSFLWSYVAFPYFDHLMLGHVSESSH